MSNFNCNGSQSTCCKVRFFAGKSCWTSRRKGATLPNHVGRKIKCVKFTRRLRLVMPSLHVYNHLNSTKNPVQLRCYPSLSFRTHTHCRFPKGILKRGLRVGWSESEKQDFEKGDGDGEKLRVLELRAYRLQKCVESSDCLQDC